MAWPRHGPVRLCFPGGADRGHFGPYGGVFVAETLIRALDELKGQYARFRNDCAFVAEFADELDLAKAYQEMGDVEGAREILQEVPHESDDEQKAEANSLLAKLI